MVGSRLTGANKVIYDALQPEIQKVAAGTRTSTHFEIPVETFTAAGIICGPWTADALGVSAIVENHAITDAAAAAALAMLKIDVKSVVYALKADFPYEMY